MSGRLVLTGLVTLATMPYVVVFRLAWLFKRVEDEPDGDGIEHVSATRTPRAKIRANHATLSN